MQICFEIWRLLHEVTSWPQLNPGYGPKRRGTWLSECFVWFCFCLWLDRLSPVTWSCVWKSVLKIDPTSILMCAFMSHGDQTFLFPSYDNGVVCTQLLHFSNCTWCKHTMWENNSSVCFLSWQMLSAMKQWLYFLICSLAKLVLFYFGVSLFKNPQSGDKNHIKWGEKLKE